MIEILVTATILCNNFNLNSYPCNAPIAEFHQVEKGFEGVLESGITFTQLNVLEGDYGRIMRISIQDAYWFITDKGVIWADTEIEALSIYLTL